MRAFRPAGWICLVLFGAAFSRPAFAQSPVVLEPPAETAEVLAARAPVDIEDLREIQEQLQRVIAQVLPATVSVEIDDAAGSGVIVSQDGLILTAAHVIGRPGVDRTSRRPPPAGPDPGRRP
jgi:serine protease Do